MEGCHSDCTENPATAGIENYPFLQYDVYNNLHLVYKELSEFPQAYHTLELAKALSDSLFVQEKKVASWKSFP